MTALHNSPSIPPTQKDIDEVEEERRKLHEAQQRHLEASQQAVAACARISTRRQSARERKPSRRLPTVGKT